MFEQFFSGLLQDYKLVLVAPLLSAIFRYIFIKMYGPKYSFSKDKEKLFTCFRYGFWWGLDFHAYVFLAMLLFISIPGAFLESYFYHGNTLRIVALTLYSLVLYLAFMGKMIFYYHFNDIYNDTMKLGKNADKNNFIDIFFNQNHGALILFGIIPFLIVVSSLCYGLLQIPSPPYPQIDNPLLRYIFNTVIFVGSIIFFYFLRFGGTLKHRNKPEWDEVPAIVKNDPFLGKATIDDLVAIEIVLRRKTNNLLLHTDEESFTIFKAIPELNKQLDSQSGAFAPLEAFKRTAKGPRISKPKHIFFIVGESYTQAPFDDIYSKLHIADRGKAFRQEPTSAFVDNFLPAGRISQPAITSLLAGIYDLNLEINEKTTFWNNSVKTSLPHIMRNLGYRTELWYGGSLSWASLGLFAQSLEFDAVHGGPDFCDKNAPHTWLGVYDHIFLDETFKKIKETDNDQSVLHFIYTTSNHGPYTLPLGTYGWKPDDILENPPNWLANNKAFLADLGTYWYTDKSIFDFVDKVRAEYPDSLFIVTGDHSRKIIPYGEGITKRTSPTIRELGCTSFVMSHPDLKQDSFKHTPIAEHMNILPTIVELIAPENTVYYSLKPSLFEPVDHIVTPYHWITPTEIGDAESKEAQSTEITLEELPLQLNVLRYNEERLAYNEITGWLLRHEEQLIPTKK